jgi:hypothetical protein
MGRSKINCLSAGLLLGVAMITPVSGADFHVAKDGNDSTGSGSEGNPFLTIQHASLVALTPGDRVIVHAGTYTELLDDPVDPGLSVIGIQPHADGITFMAAPGEHVIIDTQAEPIIQDGQPTLVAKVPGKGTVAFLTNKYDDIVIEGFEIIGGGILTGNLRGAAGFGVLPDTDDMLTERAIIRNNHIHHVYSGDNVGGVNLSRCIDCQVHDNVIHDIIIVREKNNGDPLICPDDPLNPGTPMASCRQILCRNATDCPGQVGNQNSAGVFSFAMENAEIFNNTIYNTYAGIYQKRAGKVAGHNGNFHHNEFYDLQLGIRLSAPGDCDIFRHRSVRIFNNLFYSVNTPPMFLAVVNDTSNIADQSELFVAYNNTVVARNGFAVASFDDTRMFNNIFVTGSLLGDGALGVDKKTGFIECGGSVIPEYQATLTLSDYNLFGPPGKFGVGPDRFPNLAAWRTSPTADCSLNPTPGSCGQHSIESDPLFASTPTSGTPVNGQLFTLQIGSPARGAGLANIGDAPAGVPVDMGAYPNGVFDSVTNPGGDIVGPRSRPGQPTGLAGSGS